MTRLNLSADVLALNPGMAATVDIARDAKRGRVPRAPADERVGLSGLLLCGWSPVYDVRYGHRLTRWRDGGTGWHEGLRAACDEAKRMQQEAL